MKFSERTVQLLNNFASICPSIVLQNDQVLRTISDTGSVLATAQIEESFPVSEFPILELQKLLNILKVSKDPDIEFVDDGKRLLISSANTKIDFWASAKTLTTLPPEKLELTGIIFEAEITGEQLREFSRACSTLGHKRAEFSISGGKTYITGTTPDLDNSNNITIELGETTYADCKFPIDTDHMKLIDGTYVVQISSEMELVNFISADGTLNYYIGKQLD